MSSIKLFIITILSLFLVTCGSNQTQIKKDFSIQTNTNENKKSKVHTISRIETLELSLNNPKNHTFSTVGYTFDGQSVDSSISLKDVKLGKHTITATIDVDGNAININKSIVVLNDLAPIIYTYKIINEYPHDITSYTQGLEFYKGELYESTGQYGESKLRKVDFTTAEVLKNVNLTNQYFAEGLTIFNDKIYQLTWQENIGFVYDINTFEKTDSFKYGKSKEGWGLCNDGLNIYKSDGTEHIWTLDTNTLAEKSALQVYTNNGKVGSLNELEWINGSIYANIYQRNGVVIINPGNGAVEGVVDFTPLSKLVKQHRGLDVLNGIAFNPETNTIFVTGKRWDKLFEVEIIEK